MLMCDGHELDTYERTRSTGLAERWISSRLSLRLEQIREGFETYRFDLSSQAIYEFVWDEYCDWYIELAKVTLNDAHAGAADKSAVRRTLVEVLECSLRALHPIMPYITDEIWLKIAPVLGADGDSIMLQPFPQAAEFVRDEAAEHAFEWLRNFILGVRRIRAENNIDPNRRLDIQVQGGSAAERVLLESCEGYIKQLARVESLERVLSVDGDCATALAGETTVLVPLSDLIDVAVERQRLTRDLEKMGGELQRASGKLENPAFVEKAPAAVVEKERARVQTLRDQIARIEAQLAKLG
jgi:valyl-tRNA synthetase